MWVHCEKGNISCERKVCTPKSRNDEWIAKKKEKEKEKENSRKKNKKQKFVAIRLGVQRIKLRGVWGTLSFLEEIFVYEWI